MFVVDGIDYTFWLFGILAVIVTVAIVFTAQYMLCSRAKKTGTKLIPLYGILFLVAAAIFIAKGDNGGSPIDLRAVAALMVLAIAFICGVSSGAAWVIYRMKSKKVRDE